MEISVAQFLSIATISYLCGMSVVSGFALSALMQLYPAIRKGYGSAEGILWIAAMCLGMAATTLGPLFAFVLLVIGDEKTGGSFAARAAIFLVFLSLGLVFSFVVALFFNRAARFGKIVAK